MFSSILILFLFSKYKFLTHIISDFSLIRRYTFLLPKMYLNQGI